MVRTRQDGRVARLLALLGVLLGLLAMHGLIGTHHAAAAVPAHPATGPAGHHHVDVTDPRDAAPQDAQAVGSHESRRGACDERCTTAVLCLAILTAAAAAAGLAVGRRRAPRGTSAPRAQPRAPAAARRALRPPDLVTELCISRT